MMQHGEEIKAKWNAVFAASVSPDADPPQLFLDFGFLNESEQEKTREIIQDVLLEVKICRDIIAHGHTYDGFLKANDSMNFTALRP